MLFLAFSGVSISEIPTSTNAVLDKFLNNRDVRNVIDSYDALIVSRSGYCREGCQALIDELSERVVVKVFDKEDIFMRKIYSFVEIAAYDGRFINGYVYDRGNKRRVEID